MLLGSVERSLHAGEIESVFQCRFKSRTVLSNALIAFLLADDFEKCVKEMVSRAGLEPATTALKVRCSTN